MIGNDIVDLNFATLNSRWQEQRFLDKLFSGQEQDFIFSDGSRFENIWRLWSMKESTYKAHSTEDVINCFNPEDFECYITNTTQGYVIHENISFLTLTEKTQSYIQTTAFVEHNWISEIFQIPTADYKQQHTQSYQHAIKTYARLKNVTSENIDIIKNKLGVPQFYIDGKLQKEQLSLSHHGYFGASVIAV